MSRGWISESELRAVRTALSGAWRPARPEAEILRSLSWFPDERLVSWFLEGDGCAGGSVEALTLDAALSWRRQLLLRDLPSPLSSKDRFLPLIRCEAGFLIYDGAAKGVALRRTKAIERYPDALKDPLGLRALFEEDEAPGQYVDPWAGDEEEEEEEEPPERPVPLTLDKHLARLIQHHQWPTAQPPQELLTRLTPLCAVPELAEWFACVGEQTRLVFSDLRAFSFADALICRDELEGASSAALQAELHHQRWMPLLELPGRHAVLYWKDRGVRLHVFRAGAWQAAPWSRSIVFTEFIAALSGWTEPALPLDERANAVLDLLDALADKWLEDPPDRDLDATRLAGFSAPTQAALEAWFAQAPAPPFLECGERVVTTETLEPGQLIVPLLEGDDGVQTCAIEGRGVAFRLAGTRLPWAFSVTSWVRALLASASRRWSPDVTVTRNFVGHYRVELPSLPFELARRIENVTGEEPHTLARFSVFAGAESRIDVDERGWPIVVLDGPAQQELVRQLDALQEPELTWLSVTLVFKPLL